MSLALIAKAFGAVQESGELSRKYRKSVEGYRKSMEHTKRALKRTSLRAKCASRRAFSATQKSYCSATDESTQVSAVSYTEGDPQTRRAILQLEVVVETELPAAGGLHASSSSSIGLDHDPPPFPPITPTAETDPPPPPPITPTATADPPPLPPITSTAAADAISSSPAIAPVSGIDDEQSEDEQTEPDDDIAASQPPESPSAGFAIAPRCDPKVAAARNIGRARPPVDALIQVQTTTTDITFVDSRPLGMGLVDARDGGVVVRQVHNGGMAHSFGVHVGSKLVAVNGAGVMTVGAANASARIAAAGRPVRLTFVL